MVPTNRYELISNPSEESRRFTVQCIVLHKGTRTYQVGTVRSMISRWKTADPGPDRLHILGKVDKYLGTSRNIVVDVLRQCLVELRIHEKEATCKSAILGV